MRMVHQIVAATSLVGLIAIAVSAFVAGSGVPVTIHTERAVTIRSESGRPVTIDQSGTVNLPPFRNKATLEVRGQVYDFEYDLPSGDAYWFIGFDPIRLEGSGIVSPLKLRK